jgi:hypothetical protein
MSEEYVELRGSTLIELTRVDLILCQLARPTLDEDSIPTSTRAAWCRSASSSAAGPRERTSSSASGGGSDRCSTR